MNKLHRLHPLHSVTALNLNSNKKTNKELEIEYVSCTENPQYYELKFSLTHTNLNSNSASFFVNEESNELSVIPINSDKLNIGRSDRSTFIAKINKNEIPNFKISEMSFKAFILCDGLAAETKKFAITGKSSSEKDITEIDEDDKERYIRKTLHKIRNFKPSRRNLDIKMSTYAYQILNFNLNDKKVSRIIMQVKNNNYLDIDVTKFKNVESTKTNISDIYTGFLIDDKLGFYFDSKEDKDFVLNYLNGKGVDSFIPAFSKLNIKTIESEVAARNNNNFLVKQGSSSLCGIVCIAYLMLKYQQKKYNNFVYDLYYYAEAFYGPNNFLIKPRNSLFGQIFSIGFNDKKYPNGMPQADYISLSSIKCSENSVLSYDGKDDGIIVDGLGSMSTASELIKVLDKMLTATEIENNTTYSGQDYDEILNLGLMDNNFKNGYECLMLIDATMVDSKMGNIITTNLPWPNHWVMYQGGLNISSSNVTFKVSSWGFNNLIPVKVTEERFKDTFYGYIKCKLIKK